MPFTIDRIIENSFLIVRFHGRVGLAELISPIPSVIKLFSTNQKQRLLLDLSTSVNVMTIEDYYDCMKTFKREFTGHMHIALYWPNGKSLIIRFLMNLAINRGLHLRIFDNLTAASNWLET